MKYLKKSVEYRLYYLQKNVILPEETLIIFDEIQEAPKAISSLKYFCENAPEYAVIAAGSLLGVAIHQGISFPVGKVDTLEVHPMSYYEFLLAAGEEAAAELLISRDYDMIQIFSGKYIHWLKLYYYVGGMPEVVNEYLENGDVTAVRQIQNRILEMYEEDFSKHTPNTELARMEFDSNNKLQGAGMDDKSASVCNKKFMKKIYWRKVL